MKNAVVESIAAHLANEGVRSRIGADTQLMDLDVDSLGLYSMLAALEDEYDVVVSCGRFAAAESVGDLADAVIDGMPAVAKAA